MATDREIALEQAAAAILAEAKAAGLDLPAIAERAKSGIAGNKSYVWVGAEHKVESGEAIDYLLQSVR
ncbi:hypothetical protein KRX52_04210 [Pseudomonas sp. MAP12]|uniref:Uncharacterized protein n=1 Tax=Geopseudomonas aromaticivorans TaxID=2849492 RepID=A0ABS6MT65_9GAMM|nr:hypothetical protein [Pseudomonas aromaticivorans]MBV2132001.1 hypothetical protein [Pseudomonas aromaticivorans]